MHRVFESLVLFFFSGLCPRLTSAAPLDVPHRGYTLSSDNAGHVLDVGLMHAGRRGVCVSSARDMVLMGKADMMCSKVLMP